MKLVPRIKLWLSSDEADGVFGSGKYRLLKAIEQYGSLSSAAESLHISYRKAWGDLKKAERCFGKQLIVKNRGGQGGGSTYLTQEGKNLVKAYSEFLDEIQTYVEEQYKLTMEETINENF